MHCRSLLLLLAAAVLGMRLAAADDAHTQDEQAIRAAAKQYVEALATGDAKALAALWAPGGELVDAFGHATPAERLIEQEAQTHGAAASDDTPRPHVEVTDNSIRFVAPDVALEDGSVSVKPANANLPPVRGRYLAVWVKAEGKWRLASLREMSSPATPADDLAALNWMAGDWSGEVGQARFHVSAHWNPKHTYLERDLTVTHNGQVVLAGQQRIGIDPHDGKIRSWMHDDEGGHGEGLWSRHGDTWVVQAQSVTPDGRHTSATNVYTRQGDDGVLWKSIAGLSDGQGVPDFQIELKRAAPAGQ